MSVAADKPRAVLSEREEAFDRARQAVGLLLAPVVFALVLLLPLGLEQDHPGVDAIVAPGSRDVSSRTGGAPTTWRQSARVNAP